MPQAAHSGGTQHPGCAPLRPLDDVKLAKRGVEDLVVELQMVAVMESILHRPVPNPSNKSPA